MAFFLITHIKTKPKLKNSAPLQVPWVFEQSPTSSHTPMATERAGVVPPILHTEGGRGVYGGQLEETHARRGAARAEEALGLTAVLLVAEG
ncbi:hypothetical protein ES332_D10G212800v1 [Gossypium tomentosum]|uniref:Uncharacterized protein n=1 Tax=Gossypium tomentosum TaxID=34277 RepID=A0A5D2J7W6_GOSTO|nr:hypothetical protein ES332_D10G212800v1 [Gossypium tomentosum]